MNRKIKRLWVKSRMNEKIKKQWVKALTSGKYTQGINKLRYGNQNGTKHCCLGVLTDLAVKAGVCGERVAYSDKVLCDEVVEWAGLDGSNPECGELSEYGFIHSSLSTLNDKELYNFKQIAEVISRDL